MLRIQKSRHKFSKGAIPPKVFKELPIWRERSTYAYVHAQLHLSFTKTKKGTEHQFGTHLYILTEQILTDRLKVILETMQTREQEASQKQKENHQSMTLRKGSKGEQQRKRRLSKHLHPNEIMVEATTSTRD